MMQGEEIQNFDVILETIQVSQQNNIKPKQSNTPLYPVMQTNINEFLTLEFFENFEPLEVKSVQYDMSKHYPSLDLSGEPSKEKFDHITKITSQIEAEYINSGAKKQIQRDAKLWKSTLLFPGNSARREFLERLFTLLRFGGMQFHDGTDWKKWSDTKYNISSAMSHGGTIFIQTPPNDESYWQWLVTGHADGNLSQFLSNSFRSETAESESKNIFLNPNECISLTEMDEKEAMVDRFLYFKHYIRSGQPIIEKQGFHTNEWLFSNHKYWGMNIPFGGMFQPSLTGETISSNGEHGFLYLHHLPSLKNRPGAILISVFGSEHGKFNQFGTKSNDGKYSISWGLDWNHIKNGPRNKMGIVMDLTMMSLEYFSKRVFSLQWLSETSECPVVDISLKIIKSPLAESPVALNSFEFTIVSVEKTKEESMFPIPFDLYTIEVKRVSEDKEIMEYYQDLHKVKRRYSDFEWLERMLIHTNSGCIVPPIPPKSLLTLIDKYYTVSPNNTEIRSRGFLMFLQNIDSHPILKYSEHLRHFLQDSPNDFKQWMSTHQKAQLEDVLSQHRTWLGSLTSFWSGSSQNDMIVFLKDKRSHLKEISDKFVGLRDKIDKIIKKYGETGSLMKDMGDLLQTCNSSKLSEQYSRSYYDIGHIVSHMDKVCMEIMEKIEFQQNILINIELQLKNIEMIVNHVEKDSKMEPMLKSSMEQFERDYKEYLIFKNRDFKWIVEGFVQVTRALIHELTEVNF